MCPVSGTLVAGGFIDSLTFLLDHMNRLTSGLIFPVPHSADVFENLKYMDLVRGGKKRHTTAPVEYIATKSLVDTVIPSSTLF